MQQVSQLLGSGFLLLEEAINCSSFDLGVVRVVREQHSKDVFLLCLV